MLKLIRRNKCISKMTIKYYLKLELICRAKPDCHSIEVIPPSNTIHRHIPFMGVRRHGQEGRGHLSPGNVVKRFAH